MRHYLQIGCYLLAANLIISSATLAQAPLTPGEAQREATTLLGKQPDRVETYFLQGTNYLAFSVSTNVIRRSDIWIYARSGDQKEFRQVWHDTVDLALPERFVQVAEHKTPCLLMEDSVAGSGGESTNVGLYCPDSDTQAWVGYSEMTDSPGVPRVFVSPSRGSDPALLAYIESLAHKGRLDKPDVNPDPENLANVEQVWLDDNGDMTSGMVKVRYFGALKSGLSNTPLTVGNTDHIHNGRYDFFSPSKGTVAGFDRANSKYFLVYIDKRVGWERLHVLRDWLYVGNNCISVSTPSDSDCTWDERFNTQTHVLQKGSFAAVVMPGTQGAQGNRLSISPPSASPTSVPTSAQQKKPQWESRAEHDAFEAFVKEQDLDRRLQLIEGFLWEFPKSDFKANAYVAEMQTYVRLNESDQAIEAAKNALKADSDDLDALSYLSFAFPYTFNPSVPDSQTQLSDAVSQAQRGLELLQKLQKPAQATEDQFNTYVKTKQAVFNTEIGFAAVQQKNYAQAITSLEAAAQGSPKDALVYSLLGQAYYEQQPRDINKAIWYLARSVGLAHETNSPRLPQMQEFYAQVYEAQRGSDAGEEKVLAEATASATPPPDFSVPPPSRRAPAGNRTPPVPPQSETRQSARTIVRPMSLFRTRLHIKVSA